MGKKPKLIFFISDANLTSIKSDNSYPDCVRSPRENIGGTPSLSDEHSYEHSNEDDDEDRSGGLID